MDGAVLEVQKRGPRGAGQGLHHPGWQTCSQGAIVMQLTPIRLREDEHLELSISIKCKLCSSMKTSPFACLQGILVVCALHQPA